MLKCKIKWSCIPEAIELIGDGPLATNILVPESAARLFEEDLVFETSPEAFFMWEPSEWRDMLSKLGSETFCKM